jgi:hypothetical protein
MSPLRGLLNNYKLLNHNSFAGTSSVRLASTHVKTDTIIMKKSICLSDLYSCAYSFELNGVVFYKPREQEYGACFTFLFIATLLCDERISATLVNDSRLSGMDVPHQAFRLLDRLGTLGRTFDYNRFLCTPGNVHQYIKDVSVNIVRDIDAELTVKHLEATNFYCLRYVNSSLNDVSALHHQLRAVRRLFWALSLTTEVSEVMFLLVTNLCTLDRVLPQAMKGTCKVADLSKVFDPEASKHRVKGPRKYRWLENNFVAFNGSADDATRLGLLISYLFHGDREIEVCGFYKKPYLPGSEDEHFTVIMPELSLCYTELFKELTRDLPDSIVITRTQTQTTSTSSSKNGQTNFKVASLRALASQLRKILTAITKMIRNGQTSVPEELMPILGINISV